MCHVWCEFSSHRTPLKADTQNAGGQPFPGCLWAAAVPYGRDWGGAGWGAQLLPGSIKAAWWGKGSSLWACIWVGAAVCWAGVPLPGRWDLIGVAARQSSDASQVTVRQLQQCPDS